MNRRTNVIVALMVVLSITAGGCTSASRYVPFNYGGAKQVPDADVCIGVGQEKIKARVGQGAGETAALAVGVAFGAVGGALGGLIAGAIANARTKAADEALEPIRTGLADYDVGKALKEAVQSQLAGVKSLRINEVRTTTEISGESYEKELDNSKAGSVLFITALCHMDDEFDRLNLVARTKLIPKTADSSSSEDHLYSNTVTFIEFIGKDLYLKEERIDYWARDNAARTREAFENGVLEIARMIVLDLTSTGNTSSGEVNEEVQLHSVKGNIVMKGAKRTILRSVEGNLYSLRNYPS